MKGYMLDSNVFDQLLLTTCNFENNDIYITTKQHDEIVEANNPELIGMIRKHNIKLAPTTVSRVDHGRVGFTILGEGEVSNQVLEGKGNPTKHIADSIIADSAVNHGMVLVTEDKNLYKKMKALGYDVLNFEEFIQATK